MAPTKGVWVAKLLEEGEKRPGWALSPEAAHESWGAGVETFSPSKAPSHSLPQFRGNPGGVSVCSPTGAPGIIGAAEGK